LKNVKVATGDTWDVTQTASPISGTENA